MRLDDIFGRPRERSPYIAHLIEPAEQLQSDARRSFDRTRMAKQQGEDYLSVLQEDAPDILEKVSKLYDYLNSIIPPETKQAYADWKKKMREE